MNFPQKLLNSLKQAQHIVVLTGAGVSAESGVPTFREAQTGLWSQYDPQELATPQAFRRNPRLVWEWYTWRRELIRQAQPNPAHLALAKMEKQSKRFSLITQNIDGLHNQAGSQNIIELHGNIQRTKCFDQQHMVSNWAETDDIPPLCPKCGSLLRPDVVWFGENLPPKALETAVAAAKSGDIFFSIGTSSLVQPAASLPLQAVEAGVLTVEINPQQTPISRWMDYVLSGPAGEILPALLAATN